MIEGKKDIVAELEDLIRLKQECTRKYQLRKKEMVDFDIRAAYDILQLSSEGDENRLRTVLNKLPPLAPPSKGGDGGVLL